MMNINFTTNAPIKNRFLFLKTVFQFSQRKFLIYLMLLFVVLTIGLGGYTWWRFLTESLFVKNTSVMYELKPKTSAYGFARDLYNSHLLNLKKSTLFILLAYMHGDANHLKAGEYLLEGTYLPEKILKKLVREDTFQRRITFLEGWNFQQIRLALQSNPYLHHTIVPLTSEEIMTKLGHQGMPPEGQFFPDTYFFARGTSDITILKKAFELMQTRFSQAWQNRAEGLNYENPYQALIAASIIEKESGFKSERPLIAGVLLKRWQKGMPLQIDSTVSYGLGGVTHLTKADLKYMTPYNTYLNKEWPPTPIAMPGLNAINAALHPRNSQFLYFVAMGTNGRTGHYFSASLGEHRVAVMRYRAQCQKFNLSLMPYLLSWTKSNNFLTVPYRDHFHESLIPRKIYYS